MSQLIKIDLDSIKLNPNYGRTQTNIYKNTDINIEVVGCEPFDYLINSKNCYITNKSNNLTCEENICEFSALILDPSLIDKLMNEKENGNCKNITINQKCNYQTINHAPISKYSYKYENIDVICKECGKLFKSINFLELDNDDDEYFNYTSTGCPYCKTWDCCEVKYESIESALIRKEQI